VLRVVDSFTDPIDHLALDEALLLAGRDAIRVWEFARPIVIAGRSTRIDDEIDRPHCEANQISIVRRCTGGASVVGGPGCLMYSIILSTESRPSLRRIDAAHDHVMTQVLNSLQQQLPDSQLQGICDLTWNNKKCSGNSLRVTRNCLLYHGTILYDFDLGLIAQCLKTAPRQPAYRAGRDHASFVTNVPFDSMQFGDDLCGQFQVAGETGLSSLLGPIRELRRGRYDDPAWHFRH
jgi:lipoate-protein ligase A